MNKIVERELLLPVKKHLSEKEITLIHGARQVGKTTLLMTLIELLKGEYQVAENQILYYNLDLFYEYEKWVDQRSFIQYLQEKSANWKTLYLFVDEAQYLDEAGRYLKGIFDLDLPIKMIITGSSSLLLAHHTRESLMGRKQIFTMRTFSFQEFMSYEKSHLSDLFLIKHISQTNKEEMVDCLNQYLYYGGYPKVVISDRIEQKELRLKEIFSSYIDKDISQFLGIQNKIGFSRVLSVLADQIGNLVNMTEVANRCQLSHQTVKWYLEALEGTYMISLLRPFSSNVRSELVKMPKIYFSDLGFRNIINRGFSKHLFDRDRGALLENYVFNELVRKWEDSLHYWRLKDGTEVDFIVRGNNGELIPIEVKASFLHKPSVPISLRSFARSYSSKDAYIVNLDFEEDILEDGIAFHFILPWQLSLIQ